MLPDDNTGLYDPSRWAAVLFLQGDLYGGYGSDLLTVYWPGAFPDPSIVQSFDQNIANFYGGIPDSDFFVQSTPPETVYAPGGVGGGSEYHVFTPEPRHTLPLLGFGLAMMGGVVLSRRRGAGTSASI